jgi:hypothetical protein
MVVVMSSACIRTVGVMNTHDAGFDDEDPFDWFLFDDKKLRDGSIFDRDRLVRDPRALYPSRMQCFWAVLRDAFEHFGFDSPIYPYSD